MSAYNKSVLVAGRKVRDLRGREVTRHCVPTLCTVGGTEWAAGPCPHCGQGLAGISGALLATCVCGSVLDADPLVSEELELANIELLVQAAWTLRLNPVPMLRKLGRQIRHTPPSPLGPTWAVIKGKDQQMAISRRWWPETKECP